MAYNRIKYEITADPSPFERAMGRVSESTEKTKEKISAKIKAGAMAGAAALTGLVLAMNKAVDLAKIQQDAEAKLGAVLKATGEAAGFNLNAMKQMASGMQAVTTTGDEVILNGMSILATFKNVQKDGFERATMAALDMSAVMGKDLNSSIMQIGKALNDPIKGMSALSEAGVSFNDQQKEQIKYLQESGDLLGAQAIILAELEGEFGGVATAMRDTWGGSVDAAQNAWGDLMEEVGKTITQNKVLIEVVHILEEQFLSWGGAIAGMRDENTSLSTGIATHLVGALRFAVEAVGFLHVGWVSMKAAVPVVVDAFVSAGNVIFDVFRRLLTPLDLMFDAWVKLASFLGKDFTNPLDHLEAKLESVGAVTQGVMEESFQAILDVQNQYAGYGEALSGVEQRLMAAATTTDTAIVKTREHTQATQEHIAVATAGAEEITKAEAKKQAAAEKSAQAALDAIEKHRAATDMQIFAMNGVAAAQNVAADSFVVKERLKTEVSVAESQERVEVEDKALASMTEGHNAYIADVNGSIEKDLTGFLTNAFTNMEGGWRGMWDNMLSTLKGALLKMAAEWASSKIMSFFGLGGGEGSGGGGGLLGGLLGMLKGGGGSGGGGGIMGAISSGIGKLFSGGGSGGSGGGGGILAGLAGGLGKLFSDKGGGLFGGVSKSLGDVAGRVKSMFGGEGGGGILGGVGGALTSIVGVAGGVKKLLSGDGSVADVAKTAKNAYQLYDKASAVIGGMSSGLGGAAAAAATSTNLALGTASPAIMNAYAATQMAGVGAGVGTGAGAAGAAGAGAGMGAGMAGGLAAAPVVIGMMAQMMARGKDRTPLEVKMNKRGGIDENNIAISDKLSKEMDEAVRTKLQKWSVDKMNVDATSMNRQAGVAVLQKSIGGGSGDGADQKQRKYSALKKGDDGAWSDVTPLLNAMTRELAAMVPAAQSATDAQMRQTLGLEAATPITEANIDAYARQIAEQYKMPELADEMVAAYQDMQSGAYSAAGSFDVVSGTMSDLGISADKESAMISQMSKTLQSMGDASDATKQAVARATAEMFQVPEAANRLGKAFNDVGNDVTALIQKINKGGDGISKSGSDPDTPPDTGGHASGTNYIPKTGKYLLHRGERVTTAARTKQEDDKMAAMLLAIARFTQKTADALDRIEHLGLPDNMRAA